MCSPRGVSTVSTISATEYATGGTRANRPRATSDISAATLEEAPLRWGPCPNHPYPVVAHPKGKDFVDLDEDLQTKDIENSVQEGFDSPELLKRFSTVGMGPSQGKYSSLLSLRILTRTRGEEMGGKVVTTARPYSTPVRLGHLAGRTFTALRRTPAHAFHTARNAKLMYAGNWLRPEYYPIEGKTREQCIEEEALCVRNRIGLIDLGTLGGIDLSGPDAAAFLGRIYCGAFMKLKVGGSRYSLMVDESGVVIDDGVICRLAEDRFYFTTTTTGSDAVYRTTAVVARPMGHGRGGDQLHQPLWRHESRRPPQPRGPAAPDRHLVGERGLSPTWPCASSRSPAFRRGSNGWALWASSDTRSTRWPTAPCTCGRASWRPAPGTASGRSASRRNGCSGWRRATSSSARTPTVSPILTRPGPAGRSA